MAKKINRLNALEVSRKSKPGWYPDGMGLYLQISRSGTKSWCYRYWQNHKEHKHGLGAYPTIRLEAARKKAEQCRQLISEGIDPIEHKRQQIAERKAETAKGIIFRDCAIAYIESHKAGWKNRKHESQWLNSLQTYAFPVIGDLPVQDVDVGLVMKVLEPIWYTKTETASRVRQRIENILDWAKVREYRTGENPAMWRGHLDKLLPKRSKVQKVNHFPAMPYLDVPKYFQTIQQDNSIVAKAMAFTMLTATRSNEAREAKWDEIDLQAGIWTIPAERMKGDRSHRVPLSQAALDILSDMTQHKVDDYIFPGQREGRPVSDGGLLQYLQKTHPALTVHGFRSSFRDWCAEMTNYPRELAESALAHTLKDKTEAAYQRGDLFIKRSKLMNAWAEHCQHGATDAEVIPLLRKA